MPGSHPSPLALEAVLLGQASAETARHASACDACRTRLTAMEQASARFSPTPASLSARRAFTRADRRWKQHAGLASLAPLAALLALVAWSKHAPTSPVAPTVVAADLPRSMPRQGREFLEPRGGAPSPRARQLTVRGRSLDFSQGTLEGATTADGPTLPFTLVHTKVDAAVAGLVSEVTVTQTFHNPFAQPVEALYVFPLPDDAAVHELSLVAGGRVIRASVQKRAEARRQYETAKAEGRRAALLDQDRPNVFTQSVANLLPGERVEVRLSYVAPLHFDDGVFSFVFPMVVGPRFIPGVALPGESEGSGAAQDTDQVPDASRVTPPVSRSGRDVEVSLRLEAGAVIEELWSVSHRLVVDRPGAQRATLSLDVQDTVPNKDLIVRWRTASTEARAGAVAEGGAFALMLTPEPIGAHAAATPKELVFLIDTSCSMTGAPLAAAKRAMGQALRRANEGDTFLLIDFAERARAFSPAPLAATSANVGRALTYLESLPAAGGTNQLAGLRGALDRREDPERVRMVLLLTDGFIGNEDEVLATTRALRGSARVFGLGIGSSVNHFLLSRLSEEGRGFYQFVRPDEDASEAVERFVRRIARPLITDVTIDWGGLPVADVLPEAVPDLFDAQPLAVYGRYRGSAEGTVVLRGRRAGVPVRYEVPVKFPEAHLGGRALATTWARQQVERLSAQARGGETAATVSAITALGLEHHLVTKYTSLVATEERVVTGLAARTIVEPSLPVDQLEEDEPISQLQQKIAPMRGARPSGDLLGGQVGDASGYGGLGLRGVGAGGSGVGVGSLGNSGRGGGGIASGVSSGHGLAGVGGGRGVGVGTFDGSKGSGLAAKGASGVGYGLLKVVGSAGGLADLDAPTVADALQQRIGPAGGVAGVGLGTPSLEEASKQRAKGSTAELGAQLKQEPAPQEKQASLGKLSSAAVGADPAPVTTPRATVDAAPSGALVQGSLSRDVVLRVIRAHLGEVQRCYERQLLLMPGVQGVLRVAWRVRPDGTVLDVRVRSSEFEHLPLGRCVTTVVSKWRFPASAAEWSVTFPFRLGATP